MKYFEFRTLVILQPPPHRSRTPRADGGIGGFRKCAPNASGNAPRSPPESIRPTMHRAAQCHNIILYYVLLLYSRYVRHGAPYGLLHQHTTPHHIADGRAVVGGDRGGRRKNGTSFTPAGPVSPARTIAQAPPPLPRTAVLSAATVCPTRPPPPPPTTADLELDRKLAAAESVSVHYHVTPTAATVGARDGGRCVRATPAGGRGSVKSGSGRPPCARAKNSSGGGAHHHHQWSSVRCPVTPPLAVVCWLRSSTTVVVPGTRTRDTPCPDRREFSFLSCRKNQDEIFNSRPSTREPRADWDARIDRSSSISIIVIVIIE